MSGGPLPRSLYESLLRPVLFRIDPERAHALALCGLQQRFLRGRVTPRIGPWGPTMVAGLSFPNPLGLAAGFDKDARAIDGLFSCGFGFLEVGTVTPRAQPGNPKPRLFRLPLASALINRMGFNNAGVAEMAARLSKLRSRPGPVGVNLGKNRDTPLEEAVNDYVGGAQRLGEFADYLVVNLSSPNTPGLRSLQEPKALEEILREVRSAAPSTPLFVKISPDLRAGEVEAVIGVAIDAGLTGVVCTNTTSARPGSLSMQDVPGGLSGGPLRSLSTEIIRQAFAYARGRLTIIGVGGIHSGADAWEKIQAGATLLQIYTGFVYRGPGAPIRILAELEASWRAAGAPEFPGCVGRLA